MERLRKFLNSICRFFGGCRSSEKEDLLEELSKDLYKETYNEIKKGIDREKELSVILEKIHLKVVRGKKISKEEKTILGLTD